MNIFYRMFAEAGHDEQAEILNNMSNKLRLRCGGSYGMEKQLCWVADGLNPQAQEFIMQLAEFIKIKREEKS